MTLTLIIMIIHLILDENRPEPWSLNLDVYGGLCGMAWGRSIRACLHVGESRIPALRRGR